MAQKKDTSLHIWQLKAKYHNGQDCPFDPTTMTNDRALKLVKDHRYSKFFRFAHRSQSSNPDERIESMGNYRVNQVLYRKPKGKVIDKHQHIVVRFDDDHIYIRPSYAKNGQVTKVPINQVEGIYQTEKPCEQSPTPKADQEKPSPKRKSRARKKESSFSQGEDKPSQDQAKNEND